MVRSVTIPGSGEVQAKLLELSPEVKAAYEAKGWRAHSHLEVSGDNAGKVFSAAK